MSDTFDPYHKWLGIPPAHQPADHYRLLGIEQFEGDTDVISLAADQRMTFLRTFQSGEQSELSQRLLNEVAAAKICLLNAKEKARYDAELARKTPPDAPPPLPAGDDSQGAFAAFAVGSQTDSASSRSRGPTQDKAGLRKKKNQVPVVAIAVVILLVIVLVGLILWGKEKKGSEQKKPVAAVEQLPRRDAEQMLRAKSLVPNRDKSHWEHTQHEAYRGLEQKLKRLQNNLADQEGQQQTIKIIQQSQRELANIYQQLSDEEEVRQALATLNADLVPPPGLSESTRESIDRFEAERQQQAERAETERKQQETEARIAAAQRKKQEKAEAARIAEAERKQQEKAAKTAETQRNKRQAKAKKEKTETQRKQVLRRLQPLPDSPRSPLIRRGLVEENGVWKHQQEIAEAALQNALLQRQIDLSPRQQQLLEQFIDEYRTQTKVEFEVLATDAIERRAKVGQTAPVPFSPEGWKRFHFLARYHPDVTAGEFGVPQESSAPFFQKAIAKALKLYQGTPQWTAAASLYRTPDRELLVKRKIHNERQQNLYSIYTALAKDPQVKKALRTLGHQLATVPPPPNLNGDPPPPRVKRKQGAILSKGPANDRDFEHHFVENNGKWQHLEEPRIAADLNAIKKQVKQYKAAVKDQIENSKKIQVLQVQLRKARNFSAEKRRVFAQDIHRATTELQMRKAQRNKTTAQTNHVAAMLKSTRQQIGQIEAMTQKYNGYTYREETPIEIKTNVKKLTTAIDKLTASFTKTTMQLKRANQ